MDLPSKFRNWAYFTNWKASGGVKPLITERMVPKLGKMGLKKTTVSSLSVGQKMEMLWLLAWVLYNTVAQPLGIPSWVPECYKNKQLTNSLIMEKIQVVTPHGYFTILRDLDFFRTDKMGV